MSDMEPEISSYEWMAREFDRLAILRKMWTATEVAATLRCYDIEREDGSTAAAEITRLRADLEQAIDGRNAEMNGRLAAEAELANCRAAALEEAAKVCEGDFDSEMRSYGEYFAELIRALKTT